MTGMVLATSGGPPQPASRGESAFVDFDGGQVAVVVVDGEPFPIVRHASDALGLSWSRQLKQITADPTICVAQTTTQLPGDSQSRTVVTTDLDGFVLWLAKINANRVAPEARTAVIAWQQRAGRAIRERFFGKPGAVVAATPTPRELARMVLDAEDRADAERTRADAEHERAELELTRNQEYEHAEAITITTWRKVWFSHVAEDDFWEILYDGKRAGLLINQRLTRPKLDRSGNQVFKDGKPVMKDGHEHRHPTAAGQRFLELAPNGVHGGRARFLTKVIPGKDAELALRSYLARWFGPGRRQIGA
jgi:hypothetical protein